MNSFYLYYDKNTRHALCLSPVELEEYSDNDVLMVSEEVFLDVASGKSSLDELCIVRNKDGSYRLSNNPLESWPADFGEFTQVPKDGILSNGITFNVFLGNAIMDIRIPKEYMGKEVPFEEEEISFIITKFNDPATILEECSISVAELMAEGVVTVKFKKTTGDISVFTKKIFANYSLVVNNSSYITELEGSGKINTLVKYQHITRKNSSHEGIIVTYHTSTGVMTFEATDKTSRLYRSTNDTNNLIFITKKDDPTVIIDAFAFDFEELVDSRVCSQKVEIRKNLEFSLAGFPIADNLYFLIKK